MQLPQNEFPTIDRPDWKRSRNPIKKPRLKADSSAEKNRSADAGLSKTRPEQAV